MTASAATATDALRAALARLVRSREHALEWLLNHVGSDGKPAGAELGNGWSRLPWTFALSGNTGAASAVLAWADREALRPDGQFRPGPAYGTGRFGAYPLGHFAMGAWLSERYDIGRRVLDALRTMQDKSTGGFPIDPPGGAAAHICDLLPSAQAGTAALLAGREDIVDGVYRWIVELYRSQPDLPQRLFNGRSGAALVTEVPAGLEWMLVTDFGKPRQSYYHPGIAAVFLAGYAMQRADAAALSLGHRFLELNIRGAPEQFNDPESVQICKFGWGAAAMQIADPTADFRTHLLRMSDWFIDHQGTDGSWRPSGFLSSDPKIHEKMTKTAEHAMEITAMISALAQLSVVD